MSGMLLFSRRIESFSYDPENRMLSVTFSSGHTQNFCEVPERAYHKFKSAFDLDGYFDENIYGNYPIGQQSKSVDDFDPRTGKLTVY